MTRIKNSVCKYAGCLAALALALAVKVNAQACWFYFNQPQEPKGLEKFLKND